MRLSVGTDAHLELFRLSLLSFDEDGDVFDPGIFPKGLLVFLGRFLQVRDALLQIGLLGR